MTARHDISWFRYSVHKTPCGRWGVLYAHELEMGVFDTRAEAEAYLDELNRH